MTVTVYKSTDTSAPALSGTVGSFIALMDAICVNGYGTKPSQGWTKPYSGTNRAVYRTGAGAQRYLNVVDDGATQAGSASYARVYGLESATAQNTGTGLFPTTAQQSAPGAYVIKSSTTDSVARPWYAYGNGTILYLFINTDGSNNPPMGVLIFGDEKSYVPNDVYPSILVAGTVNSSASDGTCFQINSNAGTASIAGHWENRNNTGVGGSTLFGKFTNSGFGSNYNVGPMGGYYFALPYPNVPDGGLYLDKVFISETTNNGSTFVIRGEFPGFWCPMHNRPLSHLDTFSGTGLLAGKTFETLNAGTQAQFFMETSNTW